MLFFLALQRLAIAKIKSKGGVNKEDPNSVRKKITSPEAREKIRKRVAEDMGMCRFVTLHMKYIAAFRLKINIVCFITKNKMMIYYQKKGLYKKNTCKKHTVCLIKSLWFINKNILDKKNTYLLILPRVGWVWEEKQRSF
jgi:hypothetical protein